MARGQEGFGFSAMLYALARWCCYIGGTIMTALALMSVYSVSIRALGFKPVQGDFELVQIGCAIAVSKGVPQPGQKRASCFSA